MFGLTVDWCSIITTSFSPASKEMSLILVFEQRVLKGVDGDGQVRRQGNALQSFVQPPEGVLFPEQQRKNACFILPVGVHACLRRQLYHSLGKKKGVARGRKEQWVVKNLTS
jgi:hypothetical protein